jgi:hypothetical protein
LDFPQDRRDDTLIPQPDRAAVALRAHDLFNFFRQRGSARGDQRENEDFNHSARAFETDMLSAD